MIRRHLMALRLGLMLGDWLVAVLLVLLISLVRFGDGEASEFWRRLGIDIRLAIALFGIAWVGALWTQGLYRLRARWRLRTEARDIFRATILVAFVTMSALWFFKQENVSRVFLLAVFIAQPLVTLGGRAILHAWFGAFRRRGHNTQYMLITGTGTLAQDFADRIEGSPALGLQVIGHLSVPGEPDGPVSRPILGSLDDIETIFHDQVVDEVAVCLPPTAARWLEPVTRLAADEGKTVRIPLDPVEAVLTRAYQEEFEGFLVRSLVHDEQHEVALVAKRIMDIAGAADRPGRLEPTHPGHGCDPSGAGRLADPVPPDPGGPARTAVHDLQVPDDGPGCGGPPGGSPASQRARCDRLQGERRSAGHRRSGGPCARPAWMSCRNCGTC